MLILKAKKVPINLLKEDNFLQHPPLKCTQAWKKEKKRKKKKVSINGYLFGTENCALSKKVCVTYQPFTNNEREYDRALQRRPLGFDPRVITYDKKLFCMQPSSTKTKPEAPTPLRNLKTIAWLHLICPCKIVPPNTFL
jgi:hypothetical protein